MILFKSVEGKLNGVQFSFFHSERNLSMMEIMSHFAIFFADEIIVIPVGEHLWSYAYFELKEGINLCSLGY